MTLKINGDIAQVLCDAFGDQPDRGSGAGKCIIYDGTRPANPGVAVGVQVALVTFTLPKPSFPASTVVTGGAQAAINAVTPVNAAASGTASWFRVFDSANVACWDGDVTVTAGAGDLKIAALAITSGVQTTIQSLTITQAKGY